MARYAGLRLTENCDQFGHREFSFGEQGEQAQAGGFAGRGQGVEDDFKGRALNLRHESYSNNSPQTIYAYMFICKDKSGD